MTAIKNSEKHLGVLKSESLADMIGRSQLTIFKCSEINDIDDDKLSICDNLVYEDEEHSLCSWLFMYYSNKKNSYENIIKISFLS